ncbi:MAG: hypothetical protein H7222_09390 [Methylotenera sp.]|nr:hypothetical protein [Oligoflexia bacterium]
MISNYSHHSDRFVGDRWILCGDAAVFLDPIFSSAVHVSVTSARFASKVVINAFRHGELLTSNGTGEKYQANLLRGVHRFHNLISLFYRTNFVEGMKKTLQRENMRQAFTSAVAGDVWDDENIIFKMKVL